MEGHNLVLYSTLPLDLHDTCKYAEEGVWERCVVDSIAEMWYVFQNDIWLSPSFHIKQNLYGQWKKYYKSSELVSENMSHRPTLGILLQWS
jgi:hypothetical protein